jgi:cell wall-associated NlpC family hydrolase
MWYNKYVGFPYLHLGQDVEKGIDCFNLIRHVYKEEKQITIPYTTQDFCNIVDENWYTKVHEHPFEEFRNDKWGWTEIKVTELKPFDVVIMSLGSTNCVNHCALYVAKNKILQTMIDHTSWIAPYGNYYIQYTMGAFRWKGINNGDFSTTSN